jgi:hypothetical protein
VPPVSPPSGPRSITRSASAITPPGRPRSHVLLRLNKADLATAMFVGRLHAKVIHVDASAQFLDQSVLTAINISYIVEVQKRRPPPDAIAR